jgi:exopolyphosphatase/guanosine-5'-triphosphate,3'-diphosphate pyrophosphatase
MQMRRMCASAISRQSLDRLKTAVTAQRLEEIGRDIATPDRLAVLPGGIALLTALFDTLGIERMRMSGGGLREGVLVMLARGELPGVPVLRESPDQRIEFNGRSRA